VGGGFEVGAGRPHGSKESKSMGRPRTGAPQSVDGGWQSIIGDTRPAQSRPRRKHPATGGGAGAPGTRRPSPDQLPVRGAKGRHPRGSFTHAGGRGFPSGAFPVRRGARSPTDKKTEGETTKQRRGQSPPVDGGREYRGWSEGSGGPSASCWRMALGKARVPNPGEASLPQARTGPCLTVRGGGTGGERFFMQRVQRGVNSGRFHHCA